MKFFRSLFFYLAVLIVTAPLVLLLVLSLGSGWFWPELLPRDINLRAWEVIAREPRLFRTILNTLILGGLVVMLNLFLAIPAGKALAHEKFPGKSTMEAILLLPILVPSLAIVMGIHLTMLKLGLANNLAGVVLVHLLPTLPYSIRIFRSGFENLGIKWEEQALTLGVSPGRIFWTVWLPLLIPSIRSVLFLTFVISLSQYALTALISGGEVITLAMIYFPLFTGSDRSVVAAFSLLFALLPVTFLFFTEIILRCILPVRGWVMEDKLE